MTNISFGEKLRRARIRNALSQTELGLKVTVTQATVSNWETGRITPDTRQKEQLKKILGGWSAEKPSEEANSFERGPAALAAWLTKARLQKSMSVPELASAASLSAPSVYNIESGRIANPRKETIRRLEKALNVELPSETRDEIREEAIIEGVGELIDFDPHNDDDLPSTGGIYVFYDIAERPIYVGQSSDIKSRIQTHKDKFWFRAPIVHTAAYVAIGDKGLRKQVETLLIRFLKSNAVINKQNVGR